jgi:Na+-driven multidrug efflux pump
MNSRIKEVVIHRLKLKDTWVICFVLGFIMMNYPFISIFNKPTRFFGIPLLYLYLLAGWVFSIFIVYLFSRAERHESDAEGPP